MTGGLVVDLFAGPGGWDEGARLAGHDGPIIGLEWDLPACRTAMAAGHTRVCADIATYPTEPFAGKVRGLLGSPPCFPAGTPVVTARGVLPIEDVRVGDMALTHLNRWRPVIKTVSRSANVLADAWLATTADHPFWTRTVWRKWDNDNRRYEKGLNPTEWTDASEMKGRLVAIPQSVEPLSVPFIPGRFVDTGTQFWYTVGRWLGDGWVRIVEADPSSARERTKWSRVPTDCLRCGKPAAKHGRWPIWNVYCSATCKSAMSRSCRTIPRSDILICCGNLEADGLASKLSDTGLRWYRSQERTATRFAASHRGLATWLTDNFGRYAHRKTLPGWIFGLPREARSAILDGYLDADGHAYERSAHCGPGWRVSTVSAMLAISMRILATGLGFTTNIVRQPARKRKGCIEGRAVNERPSWQLDIKQDDGRYTWSKDGHRWVKRRAALTERGVETVYDITVDEDESFVAWGFVVHNCPSFSTAGLGAGKLDEPLVQERILAWSRGEVPPDRQWADDRSMLTAEPMRWAVALQPRWIALEQVPPVLPLWQFTAHLLRQLGYHAWCGILSSEMFGVPQTRKRAILMASLDQTVGPPMPTHQAYRSGRGPVTEGNMFGPALPPPISMADAFGWGLPSRPSWTVSGGAEIFGNANCRATLTATVTGKVDRDIWVLRGNPQSNGTQRELNQPAGTVYSSRPGNMTWQLRNGTQDNACTRSPDEPAGTIFFSERGNAVDWVANDKPVRVTVTEAGILQSFRPDYPWTGTKTQQYQQVGNACPPLLAKAILRPLINRGLR